MRAEITVLGSGTSMGVPTLGCRCRVCTSPDPRDKRTRPSIAIAYNDHNVLIDTSIDFRAQALREAISRVDTVLYTHGHADHVLGLDDLRPLTFAFPPESPMPLYADANTAAILERIFEYTFRRENPYPTRARVKLVVPEGDRWCVELFGLQFQRIPVMHGDLPIAGYRFGNAAYITDLSTLPEKSLPLLEGLDVLILNALRREPHPTHSHLENSLALVEKIRPRRAWFTHMSHELMHEETEAELPPHVRLLYDGQRIPLEL